MLNQPTSAPQQAPQWTSDEELTARAAKLAALPPGWVAVPVGFVQGFSTLAHNYSLRAIPPYYCDAFSNAYRRCGQQLAELAEMLAAKGAPQPAAQQGEQLEHYLRQHWPR